MVTTWPYSLPRKPEPPTYEQISLANSPMPPERAWLGSHNCSMTAGLDLSEISKRAKWIAARNAVRRYA